MSWRESAACYGTFDPVFFPAKDGNQSLKRARAICATCEVKAECLDYGVSTRQYYGVWGGTTLPQRRRIRARRAA